MRRKTEGSGISELKKKKRQLRNSTSWIFLWWSFFLFTIFLVFITLFPSIHNTLAVWICLQKFMCCICLYHNQNLEHCMQSTKVKHQYELEIPDEITGTFFPCIFQSFQVVCHKLFSQIEKNHLNCLLMKTMLFWMFWSLPILSPSLLSLFKQPVLKMRHSTLMVGQGQMKLLLNFTSPVLKMRDFSSLDAF